MQYNRKLKLGLMSVAAVAVAAGTFLGASKSSRAQPVPVLPPPAEFVSNLDLECSNVRAPATPIRQLRLSHLNPVLLQLGFHDETATMGQMTQFCAPVAKNNVIPPNTSLAILRYVDLACHDLVQPIAQPPVPLALSQLNRQTPMPVDHVQVQRPARQLCVPMKKNNADPPPDVLRVVQFIDLACYDIVSPTAIPPLSVRISQLNPALAPLIPQHTDTLRAQRRLCVPVLKNGITPPADVLNLIRWIDVEKFDIAVAPPPPNVPLQVTHLNPLFAGTPPIAITLLSPPVQLALPVAKNGVVPPPQ